jgi:hypothetical protein
LRVDADFRYYLKKTDYAAVISMLSGMLKCGLDAIFSDYLKSLKALSNKLRKNYKSEGK